MRVIPDLLAREDSGIDEENATDDQERKGPFEVVEVSLHGHAPIRTRTAPTFFSSTVRPGYTTK